MRLLFLLASLSLGVVLYTCDSSVEGISKDSPPAGPQAPVGYRQKRWMDGLKRWDAKSIALDGHSKGSKGDRGLPGIKGEKGDGIPPGWRSGSYRNIWTVEDEQDLDTIEGKKGDIAEVAVDGAIWMRISNEWIRLDVVARRPVRRLFGDEEHKIFLSDSEFM